MQGIGQLPGQHQEGYPQLRRGHPEKNSLQDLLQDKVKKCNTKIFRIMEKVICINNRCSKAYPKNLERCPYCGTINIRYNSQTNEKQEKTKDNRFVRIVLSCVFALVVLVLLSIMITLFGWNESVGVKGLICGISIGAGTWFESWLKKKNFSFGKKRKPQVNKYKPPRRPNYAWIIAIVLGIALVSIISIILSTTVHYSKQFEQAKQENTVDAYLDFIDKHPRSSYADEARDSVANICRRCYDIMDIPILRANLDKKTKEQLLSVRQEKIDEAYKDALNANTIEGWEHYKALVYPRDYRDADTRIEWINDACRTKEAARQNEENQRKKQQMAEEENALWETEESAWETAYERHNIKSYKKYLKLFPYGEHADAAERFLIDLEVDRVFASDHGELPSMDKSYSMGTSYSVLELENRTDYDLTISFSGPDSKRVVIPPYKTIELKIENGSYRIAASVGHGVRPFAGQEDLYGCRYSSYFYIVTYRM